MEEAHSSSIAANERTAPPLPVWVLVVDDDEAVLSSVSSIIEALNYRVATATSGYEAVHRLRHQTFAAVVIDVQMPELDGFETAALLRESEEGRSTPIIFLSETSDDLGTIRRGYALGAVDYLTKPVHGDILGAKVEALATIYRQELQVDHLAGVAAEKAQEAAEAKAARRRAERTSTLKDVYLGILSHDLRTPLTAISMSAQVLERAQNIENCREGAQRIGRGARRMSAMISQLVDFTRGELGGGIPISPAQTDFAGVLKAVADEITAAHPGVEIILQTSGDLRGLWDGERLQQALTNLFGNAVLHGTGCVRATADGRRSGVLLKVHNMGPPIPADQAPHIFEPFRKKERSSGLGLGLYIVREIVRGHGGTIHVRSSADGGTTFTSYWPRSSVAASDSLPREALVEAPTDARAR
jgi:two-component system sensor histidine kinase/response regulator